ncbi:MAG: sigma-70 family RNA polymerase sigma factor [Cytophagales bacterium]
MFLSKKRLYESEEDVIEGCKAGEREAQHKLYATYASTFFGICRRYMKDERDAEEVLTNGFMKIFDNISKYKREGSFEGWMKRILINEALMYIRKNRQMFLEVDIDTTQIDKNFSWHQIDMETEDLLKLIQSLPVGYRTVFNLYAIEGYSHKEIAKQLSISENTSKSQLSRARTLLQDRVQNKKQFIQKGS